MGSEARRDVKRSCLGDCLDLEALRGSLFVASFLSDNKASVLLPEFLSRHFLNIKGGTPLALQWSKSQAETGLLLSAVPSQVVQILHLLICLCSLHSEYRQIVGEMRGKKKKKKRQ